MRKHVHIRLLFCIALKATPHIVAICTRNGGKGGYVSTAFYVVFGLIALLLAGSYADLTIWAVLSIIFGVICAITTRKQS